MMTFFIIIQAIVLSLILFLFPVISTTIMLTNIFVNFTMINSVLLVFYMYFESLLTGSSTVFEYKNYIVHPILNYSDLPILVSFIPFFSICNFSVIFLLFYSISQRADIIFILFEFIISFFTSLILNLFKSYISSFIYFIKIVLNIVFKFLLNLDIAIFSFNRLNKFELFNIKSEYFKNLIYFKDFIFNIKDNKNLEYIKYFEIYLLKVKDNFFPKIEEGSNIIKFFGSDIAIRVIFILKNLFCMQFMIVEQTNQEYIVELSTTDKILTLICIPFYIFYVFGMSYVIYKANRSIIMIFKELYEYILPDIFSYTPSDKKGELNMSNYIGKPETINVINEWISEYKSSKKGFTVMLTGPTGVGKTFLVKCLAGELNKELIIHAGNFTRIYVGSGEQRLKEMFESALVKKGILLLDEIHLIFDERKRMTGNYSEEGSLALLLTLLESPRYKDIIVVMAGNYSNNLPSTLLRAGRCDYKLELTYPSSKELLHYTQTIIEENKNSYNLKIRLSKNILNIKKNKENYSLNIQYFLDSVEESQNGNYAAYRNLIESIYKFLNKEYSKSEIERIYDSYYGPLWSTYKFNVNFVEAIVNSKLFLFDKLSNRWNGLAQLYCTAIHEIGHAVLQNMAPVTRNVRVTLNCGTSLGYSQSYPTSVGNAKNYSEDSLWQFMYIAAAGGAAEAVFFNNKIFGGSTAGISSDRTYMENIWLIIHALFHKSEIDMEEVRSSNFYKSFNNPKLIEKRKKDIQTIFKETTHILKLFKDIIRNFAVKLIWKNFLNSKELHQLFRVVHVKLKNKKIIFKPGYILK